MDYTSQIKIEEKIDENYFYEISVKFYVSGI